MKRVPMQDRTAASIVAEAAKRGAFAAPVLTNRGRVDEVFVYSGGELIATIYRPEPNALAILRMGKNATPAVVANIPTALSRVLPERNLLAA